MNKDRSEIKPLDRDTIKYIAIVAMVLNHFATIFFAACNSNENDIA